MTGIIHTFATNSISADFAKTEKPENYIIDAGLFSATVCNVADMFMSMITPEEAALLKTLDAGQGQSDVAALKL